MTPAAPAVPAARRLVVAVVVDAYDIRLVAQRMLEEAFEVATYDGGAAALAGIATARPS